MCLLLPAVFLFSGAAPEEKMELKKTATAEQLVNAIARHTETLAEYLSNEKAFEDNLMKDKVTAKGGAIAVLAHALTQYKDVPAEVHVLAIRAAGRKIATAKSQADAQAGLAEVQKSLDTTEITGAFQEIGWYEVADLPNMMEEVNYLYQGLKRTVRRSRDPEADALDAVTIAILAYPTHANEDYAFDDADMAAWKKSSKMMHDDFLAIANAIREKDTDKARELYETATRSCAACHKDFRE
jgi:hypothetical protein